MSRMTVKPSKLSPLPSGKQVEITVKVPTEADMRSNKTQITATPVLPEAPEVKPGPFRDYTLPERDLLRALILMDVKNQNLTAFSHLANLKDSGAKPQDLIAFHYARAAWRVGLKVESRSIHLELFKGKNSQLRKLAADFLVSTAQKGEYDLVSEIEKHRTEEPIQPLAPQYLVNLGLHYDRKGDIGRALEYLDQVPEKSEQHGTATFLKAIISYRSGDIQGAKLGLERALNIIGKSDDQLQLRSSAALTLARIQFQLGEYKGALDNFRQVHKSHPEWPQAMTEQSWAQILSTDYEGAAGNMFTLHTDFFKNMFAPESYVVRTVGYLNLCQYGDGLRSLRDLNKRYTDLKGFMAKLNLKRDKEFYYSNELKKLLTEGGKTNDLPKMLIVEMARSQDFRYHQGKLNSIEDEANAFGRVVLDLIALERETTAMINTTLDQIKILKGQRSADARTIDNEEQKLTQLRTDLKSMKEARKSVKSLQGKAQKTYKNLKDKYRESAELALIEKLKEMRGTLSHVMDQAEVLQYELFAGASQHLRDEFKAEGKNKAPAQDFQIGNGKRVKWAFKGEIWEDELGHFRSSLKDVCTESDIEQKQAQLSR